MTGLLPVTYIAERNNNAFKILPEQSKSEEARAILKEEFKENKNWLSIKYTQYRMFWKRR